MDEKIDNRPETIRYLVENLSKTLHEIKAKVILKNYHPLTKISKKQR